MTADEHSNWWKKYGRTKKENVSVSDLVGITLTQIYHYGDLLIFVGENNEQWLMHHEDDCCEHVYIEDICGDLSDLVGVPIIVAEESINREEDFDRDQQWTFYRFRTKKGDVAIRWYGTSNGYYSIRVDFQKITTGENQ